MFVVLCDHIHSLKLTLETKSGMLKLIFKYGIVLLLLFDHRIPNCTLLLRSFLPASSPSFPFFSLFSPPTSLSFPSPLPFFLTLLSQLPLSSLLSFLPPFLLPSLSFPPPSLPFLPHSPSYLIFFPTSLFPSLFFVPRSPSSLTLFPTSLFPSLFLLPPLFFALLLPPFFPHSPNSYLPFSLPLISYLSPPSLLSFPHLHFPPSIKPSLPIRPFFFRIPSFQLKTQQN